MKIAIIKKKDDPIALYISIGGIKGATNDAYCVYRGDLDEIKLLLQIVTKSISMLVKEPKISTDKD